MGCWNKTCGLTNLPIFAGEDIVWFLLVQSPTIEARSSYANGQFSRESKDYNDKYGEG